MRLAQEAEGRAGCNVTAWPSLSMQLPFGGLKRSGVDPPLSSSHACLHTAFIAFSVHCMSLGGGAGRRGTRLPKCGRAYLVLHDAAWAVLAEGCVRVGGVQRWAGRPGAEEGRGSAAPTEIGVRGGFSVRAGRR